MFSTTLIDEDGMFRNSTWAPETEAPQAATDGPKEGGTGSGS
jgi:hypothetical protein